MSGFVDDLRFVCGCWKLGRRQEVEGLMAQTAAERQSNYRRRQREQAVQLQARNAILEPSLTHSAAPVATTGSCIANAATTVTARDSLGPQRRQKDE